MLQIVHFWSTVRIVSLSWRSFTTLCQLMKDFFFSLLKPTYSGDEIGRWWRSNIFLQLARSIGRWYHKGCRLKNKTVAKPNFSSKFLQIFVSFDKAVIDLHLALLIGSVQFASKSFHESSLVRIDSGFRRRHLPTADRPWTLSATGTSYCEMCVYVRREKLVLEHSSSSSVSLAKRLEKIKIRAAFENCDFSLFCSFVRFRYCVNVINSIYCNHPSLVVNGNFSRILYL